MASQIEHEFEIARSRAGLNVDPIMLEAFAEPAPFAAAASVAEPEEPNGITFGDLYDAYMDDPTRDWSPTTRMAYQTTKRLVVAILGADTPVRSISRSQCREMIEVLRWQPRNASKLFPKLSPVEIAERAKAEGRTDLINAANINTYLNKLGGVLNWAVKEEMLERIRRRACACPIRLLVVTNGSRSRPVSYKRYSRRRFTPAAATTGTATPRPARSGPATLGSRFHCWRCSEAFA
ncbi:hypothetical protein [Brevundimonas sanguinis]|uniref:hypothetical protein n=1 Tax=Brevundimonas sanguinis TaxID=3021811 RepID=UPI002415619D|nr:hypothetical protein [Brevundimonas sp. NCCP 15609]